MKKQDAVLQELQKSMNSSSSSYSQIMPREDNYSQVRKDRPIVMRSIPMNKQKSPSILNPNINEHKKQSITLINSTHAYTTLSQSIISAEVYKNQGSSSGHFNSTKVIVNEQQQQSREMIFNEKLVKSTYENYQVRQESHKNFLQASTKKQPDQTSRQQFENIALELSMSSMNSQQRRTTSPKQPFKMYLDPSPPKSQPQNNQSVKQYLNAIKQMRRQQQPRGTPIKSQSYQLQPLIKKNHELQARIRDYESLIKTETQSMIMERKANQIYTEFYHTLSKMITKFIAINNQQFAFPNHQSSQPLNQSLNMEKILQTIDKLIQTFMINHHSNAKPSISSKQVQTQTFKALEPQTFTLYQRQKQHIRGSNQLTAKIQQLQVSLQREQLKNAQLRNQLLQSTQNNINAIFNTQISATCCLQNQVTKINSQMTFLKEKLNLLLFKNQPTTLNQPQPLPPQIIYLSQPNPPVQTNPFNQRKQNNIVKIYTTKSRIRESDDDSDSIQGNDRQKRRHSLSRKKKGSSKSQRQGSQSSVSSKQTKKRQQLSRKQIQNLKQAYSQTKNQLNSLIHTFSMISTSQNQMKNYFSQLKDQMIKSMNDKITQNQEQQKRKERIYKEQRIQHEKLMETEERNRFQREKMSKQEQQAKTNIQMRQRLIDLQMRQKVKQKEESYMKHIELMKQQRQQDRKLIQNLNHQIIQLVNAIAVPQKVNQQPFRSSPNHYLDNDQIPYSHISVSVDYLKLIEQLKMQKHQQQLQIQTLIKQNDYLKHQIIELNSIQQRPTFTKGVHESPNSQNQEKESIINELKGFTQMCIPPPHLITTGSNYNTQPKSNKTIKSHKHVTFNHLTSSVAARLTPTVQKIQSQKLIKVKTDSHKNLQTNFKVILHSKQTHLKSLQQEIINLEETIDYLKAQINSKERVIEQLQNYVSNLENRSLNSITLSSPAINLPEPNLYSDPMNSPDLIKHKYQNYVKNLKILLKQTRNQNITLRQQLHNFETQADQRTQSNFHLKNSATHSERTTKNFPNSSPIHVHHKTIAQVVIRKRTENNEKHQNERQQQRINSLAYDNELPETIQILRTKGRFPSME